MATFSTKLIAFTLLTVAASASNERALIEAIENMTSLAVSHDEAVEYNCSIDITSLSNVNDAEMEYIIDVTFRVGWVVEGLANLVNHTVSLPATRVNEKIGKPQLVFLHNTAGLKSDVKPRDIAIYLYPNGSIVVVESIRLSQYCPMCLQRYPFDRHLCPLLIQIFSHTIDQKVLRWHGSQPITYNKAKINADLPQFNLINISTSEEPCYRISTTGQHSCLNVSFLFEREIQNYISGIFLPSVLVVVLSWVTFFMDPNATAARTSLGILTVLTITTQSSGLRSQLPRVAYLTAIDWWSNGCLGFAFAAVIEFACVNFLYRQEVDKKRNLDLRRHARQLLRPMILTMDARNSGRGQGPERESLAAMAQSTKDFIFSPLLLTRSDPDELTVHPGVNHMESLLRMRTLDEPTMRQTKNQQRHGNTHFSTDSPEQLDLECNDNETHVGERNELKLRSNSRFPVSQQHSIQIEETQPKHVIVSMNEPTTAKRNVKLADTLIQETDLDDETEAIPRKLGGSASTSRLEAADDSKETSSTSGTRSKNIIAEKVDFYCRILFPLAFLIFNVGYWYTYLKKEKEFSPDQCESYRQTLADL